MRVLWIPVLALIAAVGCGEADPSDPGPLPVESEAGIVVVDEPPAGAAALPECDGLPRLPVDPEVVVALQDRDLAVVYDDQVAVCAAPVVTLHKIGLISDAEWSQLASLFLSPEQDPVGSSDPIPARQKGDVSSSDPIPAMPMDGMKNDATTSGATTR
jgi:hypothetical protein